MALDINKLVGAMVEAAKGELGPRWKDAKSFAEMEAQKLAQTLVSIETGLINGELDQEDAKLLLEMQKSASRTVLLALEGLGLVAAEAAINAALGAAKDMVNNAIGFVLIA